MTLRFHPAAPTTVAVAASSPVGVGELTTPPARAGKATEPARRKKPRNRELVPEVLRDRPARVIATFERDFDRATSSHPDARLRAALRRGGRGYAAAGWLVFYDALYAHPRRRKGPGECRDAQCRCVNHRTRRAQEPEQPTDA
jgi:hypothetical protein